MATIRSAVAEDLPALREVYRDAVTGLGPDAYSAAQVQAWADSADSEALGAMILDNPTWVAEVGCEIAGFCTLEPAGRVALLYVRAAENRRGIGSALLEHSLEASRLAPGTELYAEASEFSLGLFRRFGFQVVETERALWNGVEFLRYRVRRRA